MARNKADDPFTEDDWGAQGESTEQPDTVPDANVDPDRAQFLKPYHLTQREGTLELTGVSGSTEFSDVVLHVMLGRKQYRVGLRTFDPGYTALRKKFGEKRSDWHGTLRYKIMPHKGRLDGYVAVRPK